MPTSIKHFNFEDTMTIEGQGVVIGATPAVLSKIKEFGLSVYEIVADLQLTAPEAFDLPNMTNYAVMNPFMDTCILAKVYSDGDNICIDAFDVRNHIPYGNVRNDGTQGYRLGAIQKVFTVVQ